MDCGSIDLVAVDRFGDQVTNCSFRFRIPVHQPPEVVVVAEDFEVGEFMNDHVVDNPIGKGASRVAMRIVPSDGVHDPHW